jgi:hypothetical protein
MQRGAAMHKIQRPKNNTNTTKPAERKQTEMVEKRGVASNRQGIRYGSRHAGQANEHFEKHNPKHSTDKSKHGGRKPAHKTHEQRITKG